MAHLFLCAEYVSLSLSLSLSLCVCVFVYVVSSVEICVFTYIDSETGLHNMTFYRHGEDHNDRPSSGVVWSGFLRAGHGRDTVRFPAPFSRYYSFLFVT